MLGRKTRRPAPSPRRPWPSRPLPVHTLFLAAYAVLFLFAQNLAEVTLGEVIPPLGRALIGASVVLLAAALVFRDVRRGAIIASALVILWFGYGHLDDLLRPAGVSRDVQLIGWAAFVTIALVSAVLLRERWIVGLTRILDAVAGTLVALSVIQIARSLVPLATTAATASQDVAPVPAVDGARDIYFLVWDRYGSESSVDDLGAEQDDLEDWLRTRGFAVATEAHANYGRTQLSLAATLNMTPLDDVATRMGPHSNDLTPINELLQTHAVGRFLKANGYRYVHIGSWFAPTRTIRIADENLAMPNGSDFEARLDATTFGPTLDDLRGVPELPAHHVLHRATALWQLREFDRVRQEPGPKFVMLHILLPHEPYVFDRFGAYPSADVRHSRTEGENYREQMLFVNDQLRSIIDTLLAAPSERQPIIVTVGDEGPFPVRYAADQIGFDWGAATTDELETKYGILTAIHLPGAEGAGGPYPTMSSWNTFRIVLSRTFGADLPVLPDRSYTSKGWNLPYDLTDVTARLPVPYGDEPA